MFACMPTAVRLYFNVSIWLRSSILTTMDFKSSKLYCEGQTKKIPSCVPGRVRRGVYKAIAGLAGTWRAVVGEGWREGIAFHIIFIPADAHIVQLCPKDLQPLQLLARQSSTINLCHRQHDIDSSLLLPMALQELHCGLQEYESI